MLTILMLIPCFAIIGIFAVLIVGGIVGAVADITGVSGRKSIAMPTEDPNDYQAH